MKPQQNHVALFKWGEETGDEMSGGGLKGRNAIGCWLLLTPGWQRIRPLHLLPVGVEHDWASRGASLLKSGLFKMFMPVLTEYKLVRLYQSCHCVSNYFTKLLKTTNTLQRACNISIKKTCHYGSFPFLHWNKHNSARVSGFKEHTTVQDSEA